MIKIEVGPWTISHSNPHSHVEGWPKVGILHSFYRSTTPSGENLAVQAQFEILTKHGINVSLIGISSDLAITDSSSILKTAIKVSRGSGEIPPKEAEIENLDILHVHNAFPNISNIWLKSLQIPTIATIHNYRAFCARGTFTREHIRCFECVEHNSWRSVVHACYRGSTLASVPIAIQQMGNNSWAGYLKSLPLTLVPGQPMQRVLAELGVENSKILPQPISSTFSRQSAQRFLEDSWLFVGRLDRDKGILELLSFWPKDEKLTIAGSGPLEQEIVQVISKRSLSIIFVGQKLQRDIRQLMAQSKGLIFPSQALEGAPLVYGEAMSVGLPIIAAEGNLLAQQVELDNTGATFVNGSLASLGAALNKVLKERKDMSHRCVGIYEERYTQSSWLEGIHLAYNSIVKI